MKMEERPFLLNLRVGGGWRKFSGVITFGSWIRQKNADDVEHWINRNCFKIPYGDYDMLKLANEIFDRHEVVNQIPVVDENDSLLYALEREKCIISSHEECICTYSKLLKELYPAWRSLPTNHKIRILIVDAQEDEELAGFLQTAPIFSIKKVLFNELDQIGNEEFDVIADFYAFSKRERASCYYFYFHCPVYDRLDLYADLLQISIWNRITCDNSEAFKDYLRISPYTKWRLSKGLLYTRLLVPIFREIGMNFEIVYDFDGNGIAYSAGDHRKNSLAYPYWFISVERELQTLILERDFSAITSNRVALFHFNDPVYAKLTEKEIRRFQEKIGLAELKREECIAESYSLWPERCHNREDSRAYLAKMLERPPVVVKNGISQFADFSNGIFTTQNGIRITANQPVCYGRSIYFVGVCSAFGLFCEDSQTIESYIQELLNSFGYPYRVVNLGGFVPENITELLRHIKLEDGDIVINLSVMQFTDAVNQYDTSVLFNRDEVFIDNVNHYTYKANKKIASFIFEKIEGSLIRGKADKENNPCKSIFVEALNLPDDPEIIRYLEGIKEMYPVTTEMNGAIVMNANPFTLGHQYLSEYAAGLVERLYIFVVEEDRSEIPYKERLDMVRLGVSHIKNAIVLPSGKYIISSLTFPEYFEKESIQGVEIVPSLDAELFGAKIAPALHIKKRFLGQEPDDNITRQYNEFLKERLKEHDIEVIEIPRKCLDGEVISATKVREAIRKKEFGIVQRYVPEAVRRYIISINT